MTDAPAPPLTADPVKIRFFDDPPPIGSRIVAIYPDYCAATLLYVSHHDDGDLVCIDADGDACWPAGDMLWAPLGPFARLWCECRSEEQLTFPLTQEQIDGL